MGVGSSVKATTKRAVKRVLGVPGRFLTVPEPSLRILTYHSVGIRSHEMNVSPNDFKLQMQWLASHYHVAPLAAAAKTGQGIAVTLDDGYRDNLTNAAPILCELGIPATVFIVAGRTGKWLDDERVPSLSMLMNWDEIREIEKRGLTIGAHTLSHRRLSKLSEEEQRLEIAEAARLLCENLGHAVEALAYPYGSKADYDKTSMRLARECGFSVAVSNRYGVNRPGDNPWELRRIWVDATDDMPSFQAKVQGRLDLLSVLDSPAGLWARRTLNRILGIS